MKKINHKKIMIFYTILIISLLMAFSFVFYRMQHNRDTLKEHIKDAAYASRFFLTSNPGMEGPVYGNEKAGITLIAFTDASSKASGSFVQDIFPLLDKDYIGQGLLKFYHKPYITFQDIVERNGNFEDAMMLECIKTLKSEEYYSIYFEMLSNDITIRKMLENYQIDVGSYNECMYGTEILDTLYKNALEIEGLGIVGINQRFYIGLSGRENIILDGVRPYAEFQQAIRQSEIKIGN